MTTLSTVLPLPVAQACDELEAAMAREGFILKERYRLVPEELGLIEKKKKPPITIIDFEPGSLDTSGTVDPAAAALCLCQVICEELSSESTRIIFTDFEPNEGLEADVPADFAGLVSRRLARVHAALARRV